MDFKGKAVSKRIWIIALAMIVATSAVGYGLILDYTLNVPSSVVVVKADPGLELIASDNITVVTSINFGNVAQGARAAWTALSDIYRRSDWWPRFRHLFRHHHDKWRNIRLQRSRRCTLGENRLLYLSR